MEAVMLALGKGVKLLKLMGLDNIIIEGENFMLMQGPPKKRKYKLVPNGIMERGLKGHSKLDQIGLQFSE